MELCGRIHYQLGPVGFRWEGMEGLRTLFGTMKLDVEFVHAVVDEVYLIV